jgi:hypothetical protein
MKSGRNTKKIVKFVNSKGKVKGQGKGKGKVHPRTGHEGQEGSRGIALLFL